MNAEGLVKCLLAVWETGVRSLGQEDPLEKEMANQYSCLENPMDGGAWWSTVHGIAKSNFNSISHKIKILA